MIYIQIETVNTNHPYYIGSRESSHKNYVMLVYCAPASYPVNRDWVCDHRIPNDVLRGWMDELGGERVPRTTRWYALYGRYGMKCESIQQLRKWLVARVGKDRVRYSEKCLG